MARQERRMGQIYRNLSAGERALMLYREMCDGREEDLEIRRTMPSSQGRELNRRIGIMKAVYHVLGPVACDLEKAAQILSLKLLLHRTHVQWSCDRMLLHRERPDLAASAGEDKSADGTGREVVVEGLPRLWGDLLALETVLDEALLELGTDERDPRLNEVRCWRTSRRCWICQGRRRWSFPDRRTGTGWRCCGRRWEMRGSHTLEIRGRLLSNPRSLDLNFDLSKIGIRMPQPVTKQFLLRIYMMAPKPKYDPNTVERRIHFYRVDAGNDDAGRPNLYDPSPAWHLIDGFDYEDDGPDGPYVDVVDGNSLCCWADPCAAGQRFRFVKIRRTSLPRLIQNGQIGPLNIPTDSGLAEEVHLMFFEENIVGADFNFYGPRASTFAYYLRSKAPDTQAIRIDPLLNMDIKHQLDRLQDMSLLRLRVRPSFAQAVRAIDENLGASFETAHRASESETVEVVLRPEPFESQACWKGA